jgi:hypothetical protein
MKFKLAALCLLALALPAHAEDPPIKPGTENLPPGWPRPGSTTLVENDRGAAYNVEYPMGQATPLHRHRYFFAGLDLNTAGLSVRNPGQAEWSQPSAVVKNRMWWLPKNLAHQEMSRTDPGRHTVVIDITDKRVPAAKNTTSYPENKYAPSQVKVVDNDMVTIWDTAWGPREAAMSFNSRDMFLAFAEGGNLSIQEEGKPAEVKHYDTGQAIFLKGGVARAITAKDSAIHVMLVEVK